MPRTLLSRDRLGLWMGLTILWVSPIVVAANAPPQCASTAQDCALLALTAMGGRDRIEAVKSVELERAQHTLLVEQSYRQEPFITAYSRTKEKWDFAAQRALMQSHLTWPESD